MEVRDLPYGAGNPYTLSFITKPVVRFIGARLTQTNQPVRFTDEAIARAEAYARTYDFGPVTTALGTTR